MAGDWLSTYEPVLSRLNGVKDFGNGRGRAQCPLHGADAELWLSVGDAGQLLVKCYPRSSGIGACRTDEVCRAVGLDLRFLFPDWRDSVDETRGGRKCSRHPDSRKAAAMRNTPAGGYVEEAKYPYEDEGKDGQWFLAYEVVKQRFSDGSKNFPQRRPNPDFDPARPAGKDNPEWLFRLAGHVRWVLYRLRELRAALAERRDRWVWVLEGEKDVDTARALGLTATTNPGGAGKWNQPGYKEELRGCNVLVVPDEDAVKPRHPNDEEKNWISPGVEHAKAVAADLIGVAKSVHILRLPNPERDGWDFSDWRSRQAGGPEELRGRLAALTRAAVPIFQPADLNAIRPVAYRPDPSRQPPPAARQPAPAAAQPAPARAETPPASPASPPPVPPPPPAPPAQPVTWRATGPFGEAEQAADALRKIGTPPRSVAEWVGEVTMATAGFHALLGGRAVDYHAIREAAVLLMAHLGSGLVAVPELTRKG